MDWTTIIITIATCLITTLGASGIIAIVFWKSTKRKENAKAGKEEAQAEREVHSTMHEYVLEWKDLYEKKEARVNVLEQKLDAIRDSRDEWKQKYMDDQVAIKTLEYQKCEVQGCRNRQPPHLFDANGNDVTIAPCKERKH